MARMPATTAKYSMIKIISEVDADGAQIAISGPPPCKHGAFAPDYRRAAQAYILISIPTDTSTIFGAFQAIAVLLCIGKAECLPFRQDRISP
jgi:hypothetical protein